MARATRIALDLALVSLRTVGPVVCNIWSATKRLLINTPVKPLVCNPFIRKAETALDKISAMLVSKITTLRDRQLPAEAKYLEKELEKVKKKIDQKAASKSIKPVCETAWRYAKVEIIPPNTQWFFHGPGGKKLEDSMSKLTNDFIAGLEGRIREIEAEKERQIKAKETAIKAAQDKAKAEAKKREELRLKDEAKKKTLEAKKEKEKAQKVEKKAEAKVDVKTDKPLSKSEKKVAQKPQKVKKKEIKKMKSARSKTDPKAKK